MVSWCNSDTYNGYNDVVRKWIQRSADKCALVLYMCRKQHYI